MEKVIQKKAIRYLIIVSIAFIFYNGISRLWIGANEWGIHQFVFEFPLFLLFMGLLFFPQIRSALIREGLPPFAFFLIYVLFDVVYARLHRAPDLSDLQQVPRIFEFSPSTGFLLLIIFAAIPAIPAFLVFYASRQSAICCIGWKLAARVAALSGLLLLLASPALALIQKHTFVDRPWSQERTIRYNGRISYFLFHQQEKRMHESIIETSGSTRGDSIQKLFPGSIHRQRNLHIIVLESFLDPRRFHGIEFSRNPISDELLPYLNNDQFSLARSPVFGGGTAQAEFEILTGIPALRKFATPDFNVLRGGDVGAFVSHLDVSGYQSMATIASGREYYNSVAAYRSMGLESVEFPDDRGGLESAPGDHYIFDGDLFTHHLTKLERMRDSKQEPVITYMLGMYGHVPFHRNSAKRPDRIELSEGSEEMTRMTNQFFYRSQALGIFLNKLLDVDPDCLICIVSDHLPSVDDKLLDPPDDRLNSVLLLDQGNFVEISRLAYYEIPWVLWDRLTGLTPVRNLTELQMETLYFDAIKRSLLDPTQ